jgi:hypothetical protein
MDAFEFARIVRSRVATVRRSQVEHPIDTIPPLCSIHSWIRNGKEAQRNVVAAGVTPLPSYTCGFPMLPRSQVCYQSAYMALSEDNTRRSADGYSFMG